MAGRTDDDRTPVDAVTEDGQTGVIAELGELGAGAVVTEHGLAALFGRHQSSVKRAVERGELPPPIRLFGQNTWTAGVLVQHLEDRLREAEEADAQERGSAFEKEEQKRRTMLELAP